VGIVVAIIALLMAVLMLSLNVARITRV